MENIEIKRPIIVKHSKHISREDFIQYNKHKM